MGLFSWTRRRVDVAPGCDAAGVDGVRRADDGKVRAVWHGVVIAESEDTVLVGRKHYFPPEDVSHEYLEASTEQSDCYWKGTAAYYDVVVNGERRAGAAWHYPQPLEKAANLKDRIAFWRGVKVEGG